MTLRESIRNVIIEIFELDSENLPTPLDADTVEKWDSLGHIALIVQLEEVLSVSFPEEEVPNLWSEDLIFEAVSAMSKTEEE